jgi:hypothetical protein
LCLFTHTGVQHNFHIRCDLAVRRPVPLLELNLQELDLQTLPEYLNTLNISKRSAVSVNGKTDNTMLKTKKDIRTNSDLQNKAKDWATRIQQNTGVALLQSAMFFFAIFDSSSSQSDCRDFRFYLLFVFIYTDCNSAKLKTWRHVVAR